MAKIALGSNVCFSVGINKNENERMARKEKGKGGKLTKTLSSFNKKVKENESLRLKLVSSGLAMLIRTWLPAAMTSKQKGTEGPATIC